MAKKTPLMNDFRSGEMTPGLGTRFDLDAYSRGCLVMKNCMPLVEGGVMRIPGTKYVNPIRKDWPESWLELPPDNLYVLHGAPASGYPAGIDRCYKRTKELAEIAWYGGSGSGINQLKCPWALAVDDTYVYIADTGNDRIMKRLKSDLTYVTHLVTEDYRSIHANGNVFWTGDTGIVNERNKGTLGIIRSINWPSCGVEGYPKYALDITCDDTYLYVADNEAYRVVYYDLATLTYQGEFGDHSSWSFSLMGVVKVGSYLYISDAGRNKVYKVDPSDYSIVISVGHINGGSGYGNDYFIQPGELAADATRLFIVDTGGGIINVRSLTDLSFITSITTGGIKYPWSVAVDSNYIYVLDQETNTVLRYNAATCVYVDQSVQTFNSPFGMCIDTNYVYVLDQDDNLNVYRLLKSDLSYVDKYSDIGWAIFSNPQSLACDDTYLYVSDPGYNSTIHRINKSTMAYVDIITPGSTSQAMQTYIDGAEIYVCDYTNGLQRYTLATMALVSKSPATKGDPDYWMNSPCGITCDELYLYVSDSDLEEIKIYNKSTLTFVDKFSVAGAWRIAVDDTYLYVICTPVATGTTKKFLKTSPYTEVGSVSDVYGIAVDTAYRYQH